VLDVVHHRWLEQVEQGLGGRRQSIINENANENHAVQNKIRGRVKERERQKAALMRSARFPHALMNLQRDFLSVLNAFQI